MREFKKLLFVFFLMYCFVNYIYADDQTIQRDSRLLNFSYEFEKLSDDEILICRYEILSDVEYFTFNEENGIIRTISDNRINLLKLYAMNIITQNERQIDVWQVFYEGYQLSLDKKNGVFFLGRSSLIAPLLKIDGKLGTITYLMDMNGSARTNETLDFLLYHAYGETINNIRHEYKFVLIDLHEMEVKQIFYWNITPLFACDTLILRSLEDGYDFMLEYTGEFLYAIAYYNIEHNILETVFDVTGYNQSAWRYARERRRRVSIEFGRF